MPLIKLLIVIGFSTFLLTFCTTPNQANKKLKKSNFTPLESYYEYDTPGIIEGQETVQFYFRIKTKSKARFEFDSIKIGKLNLTVYTYNKIGEVINTRSNMKKDDTLLIRGSLLKTEKVIEELNNSANKVCLFYKINDKSEIRFIRKILFRDSPIRH